MSLNCSAKSILCFREKTGSKFIQILPASVYHVYRMSTQMGKENSWGTRDGGGVTAVPAGEMSTKLKDHTFCNPRKGRCGAAFRGFYFTVKEVLCGIYKPVFWRKNGLFVPDWITFWSKTIKKGGLPNHEESEKGSVPGVDVYKRQA